jgi:hypothetical protein
MIRSRVESLAAEAQRWASSSMTMQQIRAIKWLTLLGAAFLSIAVPVLLVICDLGGELTLAIFSPGLLLMSPVHNVLPALIVTVVVNAIVYCVVGYSMVWLVLRFMQVKQSP